MFLIRFKNDNSEEHFHLQNDSPIVWRNVSNNSMHTCLVCYLWQY